MFGDQRVAVVMPAYEAAKTLEKTHAEIPLDLVDEVILVDDGSSDATTALAHRLGITVHTHPVNQGYGANQKSCYRIALERRADIVVMVHPDYQYSPKLVPAMVAMVGSGFFDAALGSRILGKGARKGGMPLYKFIANRALTLIENLLVGVKLSEYHTGYRAFSRRLLETLPLDRNSDDFVFDNQMLVQAIAHGFSIGEISCPTLYFEDASSINFRRSCTYGFGVLGTAFAYRLHRMGLRKSRLFPID